MGKLFQIKEPWMRPSCGNEAKYACEHFHYSRVCPLVARSYSFFTPSSEFIGCVIFGHGATLNIGKPFGLEQNNCYELVRVALNGKQGHGQTSRIVAAALFSRTPVPSRTTPKAVTFTFSRYLKT